MVPCPFPGTEPFPPSLGLLPPQVPLKLLPVSSGSSVWLRWVRRAFGADSAVWKGCRTRPGDRELQASRRRPEEHCGSRRSLAWPESKVPIQWAAKAAVSDLIGCTSVHSDGTHAFPQRLVVLLEQVARRVVPRLLLDLLNLVLLLLDEAL